MSARPSWAQLRREGRMAERADVIAQLAQSIAGAQAYAARHAEAGVEAGIDITVFVCRLEALKGTIESGCHEGLGHEGRGQ